MIAEAAPSVSAPATPEPEPEARPRIPKYEQMTDCLRRRIEGLPNGARLPSVRALMKRYGVSMQTVAVALKQLKGERLLTARRGSGLYVSQERPKPFVVLHRSQFSSRITDEVEQSILKSVEEAGWNCLVSRYNDLQLEEKDFLTAPRASAHIIKAELVNPSYPRFQQICQQNVPIVTINNKPGGFDIDCVASDDRQIFDLLIQHLYTLGHRSFGFLVNEPRLYEIEQRIRLLNETLEARGLPRAHLIDCETQLGVDGSLRAYEVLRHYLHKVRREPPFTALICSSSVVGPAVLRVFHDFGLRVPEDCSVAAFGAEPGKANSYCNPGLTEVDVNLEQWGRWIVEILQRRLKGDRSPPVGIKVNSRLVIRESTGATSPRGGRPARPRKRRAAHSRPPVLAGHAW